MSRSNAALKPRHHLKSTQLVVDENWPIIEATARLQVSWPTVRCWAERSLGGHGGDRLLRTAAACPMGSLGANDTEHLLCAQGAWVGSTALNCVLEQPQPHALSAFASVTVSSSACLVVSADFGEPQMPGPRCRHKELVGNLFGACRVEEPLFLDGKTQDTPNFFELIGIPQ